MKISKIAKLCKDSKLVTMTQTEGGLWIGNGHAVYLLPEFTYLDQNGIALAFGLAEKDKGKIRFTDIKLDAFNLEDIDKTETPCEMLSFLFSTEKGTVRPYKTQEGVLFLYTDYLAPLRDEIQNLEIYLRHMTDGKPYFVAKIGMELYAMVIPAAIINQRYIERLEEFNMLCRMRFQNDCAEQKQEYEQTDLEG